MTTRQAELQFALAHLTEPTPCADDPRFTDEDPAVRRGAALLCAFCSIRDLCYEAGHGQQGVWGGADRTPSPSAPPRSRIIALCAECGTPLSGKRRAVCSDECFTARYQRNPEDRQMPKLNAQLRPVDDSRAARLLTGWMDGDRLAVNTVLGEAATDDVGTSGLLFSMAEFVIAVMEATVEDPPAILRAYLLKRAEDESA